MRARMARVWSAMDAPGASWATIPARYTVSPCTTAWLMRGPMSMREMVMTVLG